MQRPITGRLLFALCAILLGAQASFAQAVRFSEIQASNQSLVSGDGAVTDWIELVNTTAAPVNLSGGTLTDDEADPFKWFFPEGTIIPAGGYLVIACDAERAGSQDFGPFLNTGFSLKADGGTLTMFSPGFIVWDAVSFGAQVADLTIGRVNGVWKLCTPTRGAANQEVALGSASGLRVNEWFANGPGQDDWFEIFNTGAQPVLLSGLYVTDTLTVKTKHAIAPLSFIGSGLNAFVRYVADGNTNKGPEHVFFSFNKDGEAIGIFDNLGTRIDSVTFGAQAVNVSEGRLPDGAALITTFPGTPSPAKANFKSIPEIYVNELLAHTDPPLEDAVEFYNKSDTPINVGGWYLSNKEADLKKYRLPTGTIIPAKGYLVIYEGAFNNPATSASPFTFNSAHGDQVYLAQADANGNITGYRVGEEFEASENGFSFGHVETVAGDYKFVAMSSLTFGVNAPSSVEQFRTGTGATNSPPRIGPVVFNEVHFNPYSVDGSDNRDDEFIEIYNITPNPVPLYDVDHRENQWRLQNGVSFVFPPDQVLPPFGYALIVSFDPADQVKADFFRDSWKVPASVQFYGPFRGDLNNDGDSLELYKPDPPQTSPHPDIGFVPYIRVDKVNYTDRAPWPATADGTGSSLQRKNTGTFGNDPKNWDAADPTPGIANSAALRDTDGDGMTDVWEDEVGNNFNKNDPSDAAQDADGDGFTNVQEFVAGTKPRDATSRLSVMSIVPAVNDLIPAKITFHAEKDKSYSVLYRNSLSISSGWQRLKSVPAEPAAHDVTVEDLTAWERIDRYYQVVTP